HVAGGIAHVELIGVFRLGAIDTVRLYIDLPLTAKAVEVVDENSTHVGLNRLVDIVYGDALLQRFLAIDTDEKLGYIRQKGCADPGNLGALARGREEGFQIPLQKGDVTPGSILQHEGESTGRTHARDCRRRKTEGQGIGKF